MSVTGWVPVDESTSAWKPVVAAKVDPVARDRNNATETDFEKRNKMGSSGRELTSLATGIMSGASGLPETLDPVGDAMRAPAPTLKESLLDPQTYLGPAYGIGSNILHAGKELFSGPANETPQDAAERRAHAAGSIIGQTTTPFIGGEGAEADPLGGVGRLAGDIKSGTGRALRTSDNALKPWVKGTAVASGAGLGLAGGSHYGGPIEGAAAGGYLGSRLADALVPNHPDSELQGQKVYLANSPNRNINAGLLRDQALAAKQAVAPPQGPKVAPWQGPMPQPLDEVYGPQQNISSDPYAPPNTTTISEGRPATWTNERVLQLASEGTRDAIEQAVRRGFKLPSNSRYVMGDADYPRGVSSPREITFFGPDGQPITRTDR